MRALIHTSAVNAVAVLPAGRRDVKTTLAGRPGVLPGFSSVASEALIMTSRIFIIWALALFIASATALVSIQAYAGGLQIPRGECFPKHQVLDKTPVRVKLVGSTVPQFQLKNKVKVSQLSNDGQENELLYVVPNEEVIVTLKTGQLILTTTEDTSYLLKRPAEITLSANQKMKLSANQAGKAREKEEEWAADSVVELVGLDEGIVPVTISPAPLKVEPLIVDRTPEFRVSYSASTPPTAQLQIPIEDPVRSGADFIACVNSVGEGDVWKRADISAKSGNLVDVQMPHGVPSFFDRQLLQTVAVALVSKDAVLVGHGDINYLTPAWALLIATAIAVFGFGMLSWRVKPSGVFWKTLFIGADGKSSISLMQMTLWTVIAAWATIYVFLRSWDILAMTSEFLGLLGFAGATAVSARIIAANRQPITMDESGKLHTGRADEETKVKAKWSQLMTTQGEFDLIKFQLLLFTALIALYVVYWLLMHGSFPKLDANWLLLMGISNGVYLGNKMVGPSEMDKLKAIQNERKDVEDRIKDLNDSKNQAQVELADAERALKEAAGNEDKEQEFQEAITKIRSSMGKIDSDIEAQKKKDELRKTKLFESFEDFKKELIG